MLIVAMSGHMTGEWSFPMGTPHLVACAEILSGGQCIQTLYDDGRKGPPALSADQSPTDARVDTLLHACEAKIPVILIAGEGYGLLPWRLGCAYVVLGW
jgi:hypothetical protein